MTKLPVHGVIITCRQRKKSGDCISYFLAALTKDPTRSRLRKGGTQFKGTQSTMPGKVCGWRQRLTGHIASSVRNLIENMKKGWA